MLSLFPYGALTDADTVNAIYEVRDPAGHRLPLHDFRVQREYWALQGFSRRYPGPHPGAIATRPTIHRFGVVASEAEVRAVVRRSLQPGDTVEVTQRILGPTGSRLDTLAARTWTVSR